MAEFFGCALIGLGVLLVFLSGACALMFLDASDKTFEGAALLAIPFALVGLGLMVGGAALGKRR